MKQSFAIALTKAQVAFLKARFEIKTDFELRAKLQRIAEDLIDRQFISSVDDEFQNTRT